MSYPVDPLAETDAFEQELIDTLRAGRAALEEGHSQLRAAADALEAGRPRIIAYLLRLRDAYTELQAECDRLNRENRWLRGESDPDDTVPIILSLPRFGRRGPRLGRRRHGPPPGIPTHSHRKPPRLPETSS